MEICCRKKRKKEVCNIFMIREKVAAFISFYQKTISPDHGWTKVLYPHGFCRYYPTCSEYTRIAVLRYGVFRGVWKGVKRIVRCNPFYSGGIDRP